MTRIAVFASGHGSNYEAIAEALRHQPGMEIALLVCDNPDAYVVERARSVGTATFTAPFGSFVSKQAYERTVAMQLESKRISLLVLAGYMRIIGRTLLQRYPGRIVNVHPSLLPAFPGKEAIAQALDYGVRVTGVTVHFVDEGVDTGPIIAQEAVPIDTQDTLESLSEKIHQAEHRLYPQVIQAVCRNQVRLRRNRVCWEEES